MPFPIDKSFNKKNLTKIKQKIIKKKYKNIYSTSNILSNKISNSNSFPLKRKTLYQSLVCKITKSGNKTLGKKLLNLALVKAALFTKLNPSFILSIIFNSLLVSIEVKDVRRRGKLYKIPFPISLRRKKYLTEKWLLNAINLDKRPVPYSEKLSSEFINILLKKKSKSIFFKNTNNKLALSNRSNIHFRW